MVKSSIIERMRYVGLVSLLLLAVFGSGCLSGLEAGQLSGGEANAENSDRTVTNPQSDLPNARDSLNRDTGTTATQVSPGVTVNKGFQYRYSIHSTERPNGTFVVEVRDTGPDGYTILGVEYKSERNSRASSDTATGRNISDFSQDISDKTARKTLSATLSMPYDSGLRVKPTTPVGYNWTTSNGDITAEVVGTDTVGGLNCLVIEFSDEGETVSEMCYAPNKQVVTEYSTYKNGSVVFRASLDAVTY